MPLCRTLSACPHLAIGTVIRDGEAEVLCLLASVEGRSEDSAEDIFDLVGQDVDLPRLGVAVRWGALGSVQNLVSAYPLCRGALTEAAWVAQDMYRYKFLGNATSARTEVKDATASRHVPGLIPACPSITGRRWIPVQQCGRSSRIPSAPAWTSRRKCVAPAASPPCGPFRRCPGQWWKEWGCCTGLP